MATASTATLDPATVAQLAGLELRARYIVDGFLTGHNRSPYRGQSVEFAQHREYAPGDDVRYVDWKVFGKTDRVFLKQFEAETSLHCYLAVDVSESMAYRHESAAMSKIDYARCLAAALAHLVMRQRDSVGLATIDHKLQTFVEASNNPARMDQLLHILESAETRGGSDLGAAVEQLAARLPRRGVVIVISDFLGGVDKLQSALGRLRHARHEVIAMQVLDAAELEFPFERTTQFKGLESLPDMLVEPHGVRAAYLKAAAEFLEQVQSNCRDRQADYQLARTDAPLDAPLRGLLTARSQRRG